MNPSTATGRLVKDILWSLIVKTNQHYCCKCNGEMNRSTFSIEHLTPWLDSNNPVELFFDLENISFSHLDCNISDARKVNKVQDRELAADIAREKHKLRQRATYCPNKRRNRYLEKGL